MPLRLLKPGERKPGCTSYWLRGTVRGIPVDETTGTDNAQAAQAIRITREGEILNRSVFGERATKTFIEAAVNYLLAGGSPRFLGARDEVSGKWGGVIGWFGPTPLPTIDQDMIDRCARELLPGRGPATINRQCLTPIAAVLHHANFAVRVRRRREPKGKVRWLKPDEAERLIGCAGKHLKPLLVFLFYTGARIAEALDLQWSEVDLPNGRVVFLDTKNGESRGVPLHPVVVTALANLPIKTGHVFRTPKRRPYKSKDRLAGGQIKTAFGNACEAARIMKFTPHDCRHTWATWLYAEKRDLLLLMELGGWKTLEMVRRYAHVNPDHLRPAIELLPGNLTGTTVAQVR